MSINEKTVDMDVEPQQSVDQKIGQTEYLDSGAKFLEQVGDYAPLSPEAEKRLIRKVDWIMIPMLFITATFGAVDKVALGTAAIYGLQKDAHLHGQQYSWLGSILSLGVSITLSCLMIRGSYSSGIIRNVPVVLPYSPAAFSKVSLLLQSRLVNHGTSDAGLQELECLDGSAVLHG